MPNLHQLKSELLNDRKITVNEVAKIGVQIQRDGRLDLEDIKFMIDLLTEADEVCPEFDEILFLALRGVLLADGKITLDEQFQLLRMLYSDGSVRESEKQFLRELRDSVTETTPEFEQLCETALACPTTDWEVGGRTAN